MLRPVQQLAGQICIALVDGVQPGIAQLGRPMVIEFLLDLTLQTGNLCLAKIAEAVDAVGGKFAGFGSSALEVEVNELSGKVVAHVILDFIAEQADLAEGIAAFVFQADINIEGFLRFQIGVANPVPAQMFVAGAAVHFPVVVELAQPGLGIAGADIGFQAAAGRQLPGHPQIEGGLGAKQVAVIKPEDGGQDGAVTELPDILDKHMLLFQPGFADDQLIFARLKPFAIVGTVEFYGFVLPIDV